MAVKNQHSSGSKEAASGQTGAMQEQVSSGKIDEPNNLANNRDRVAAAGRKGGRESHKVG